MPSRIEITTATQGEVQVLVARGSLDANTSGAFEAKLLEAVAKGGPPLVVVDMAGVDFVSSAGLRALLVATRQARARLGALAVACLTDAVRDIFEISRFYIVVPVHPTVEAAVASISPPSGGEGSGSPSRS